MDGCPHNKDIIPIRLMLSGIDLDPTKDYEKIKIKNYIILAIIDE